MMAAVPEERPITIAEAIARAQDIRSNPGMTFGELSGRQIIRGLLAALQVNPSYLKAVRIGEPVFVLRAQDELAPQLVRQWARLADASGCPAEKVNEANSKALRMENWAPRKYPD